MEADVFPREQRRIVPIIRRENISETKEIQKKMINKNIYRA